MKVFILGRTQILFETTKRLSKDHTIVGILTAPAAAEYSRTEKDFELLSNELNCPYQCSSKLDENTINWIQSLRPDVVVSLNWVSIVKDNLISIVPNGVLNAHFGDLPRYRGNAVINWAILKREPNVVLTIHKMDPGELDSGDILSQKRMELKPVTTIRDILDFAEKNIPDMYLQCLNGLENNTISPKKQSETGIHPFRCYPRLPIDGKINWNWNASAIDALIRASTHPYPGAFSYLKIQDKIRKLYIWESSVSCESTHELGIPGHIVSNDSTSGESKVFTGGGILILKRVQYEGENTEFQPGKAWKSIRMRFGIDLEEEIILLQHRISALERNSK